MAKPKKDSKSVYKAPRNIGKAPSQNPKWLLPTIIGLLVFGPLWIIISYITGGEYPMDLGNANLLVGFAALVAAMILLTRWK